MSAVPTHSQPFGIPRLDIWGATDRGRQREGNEDAVYPHSSADTFPFQPDLARVSHMGQILVVADGVGGGSAGSEASRWVRRVVVERYYDSPPDGNPGQNLQQAVAQANAALYHYLQSTGARGAGSTIVSAVILGDILYVAHVGDSRAYLFRNGQWDRITTDHTLAQFKYDKGQISLQQLETDPDRDVLTRSMGSAPEVEVDLNYRRLQPGDVVLLCSDGLTDVVGEGEIAQMVRKYPPRRAAQELVKLANKRGGPDNISVVVARVGGRPVPVVRARARRPTGLGALPFWQKMVLLGLAIWILLVFGLMGFFLIRGVRRGVRDGGSSATATLTLTTAAPTTPAGGGIAPTEATTPTPGTTRPTSTPAPTPTPPPTPVPPTKTKTPTPSPTPALPPAETPTTETPPGGETPSPPPQEGG